MYSSNNKKTIDLGGPLRFVLDKCTLTYIYQLKIELVHNLSPMHHAVRSTTQTMHCEDQWRGIFLRNPTRRLVLGKIQNIFFLTVAGTILHDELPLRWFSTLLIKNVSSLTLFIG
jgi:hypothetical protein